MRVGIADHFGWAVAVTTNARREVVDRRRIELVEPGVTPAPIHYDSAALDVEATAAVVATVRASVVRATSAAFDSLTADVGGPIESVSMRAWPADFPGDIAIQRMPPYESRADAIMYRQVMADVARARGWRVLHYAATTVVSEALARLGAADDAILRAPRERLGPPWAKDHRVAFAATIVAG